MPVIKNIIAREILDSRGFPTVEAELELNDGVFGRASVPSGASTGSKEACELRDGDKRYDGKGVLKAVGNVNREIAANLVGKDFANQQELDELLIKLDGSENKSRLGANAILATSLAYAKAIAVSQGLPLFKSIAKVEISIGLKLPIREARSDVYKQIHKRSGEKAVAISESSIMPRPMVNIINGGAHANNGLSFQEFMIIPLKYTSFREALRMSAEIFHTLKKLLHEKGYSTDVGDEGGFAPQLSSTAQALDFIMQAISASGYKAGEEIGLGLDVAASEFYSDGKYQLS